MTLELSGQVTIACVVEGVGDVLAVPALVRRIAGQVFPAVNVQTPKAIQEDRGLIIKPGRLERAVRLAYRKGGPDSGVLIVFDADDDPPCLLGPQVLQQTQELLPGVQVGVVLAKHEFENWFVASAVSLAAGGRLRSDLAAPADAEAIRDAKGWVQAHMVTRRYSPPVDQPRLASLIDLEAARAAPSFDKLWREVVNLITALAAASSD